jgi:hypothetical protein
VAIIGSVFAVVGRFAGKLLNAVLGWATVLLFGKVPDSKQWILLMIALGSIVWVILIVGVVIPQVATVTLAFVPIPSFVDQNWVRVGMFIGALVLPLAIGVAAVMVVRKEDRPKGAGLVVAIARGYPFAFVLSVTMVVLAGVALFRKIRSLSKRWTDAHVPVIVKPGGYDQVLEELEDVLDAAGLSLDRKPAPRILSLPPRILNRVAGRSLAHLVPDRLMLLASPSVEVLVYPSDVAISGKEDELARARAAIADRLTHAPAYLTMSEEAEKVEDRLGAVAASDAPLAERLGKLKEIDSTLAALTVPFDEWETLYRERLQIERDILASALGTESGPPGVPGASGTTQAAEIPGALGAGRSPGNGPAVVTGALMAIMVGYGISQLVDRIVGGRGSDRPEHRPDAG